MQPTTSKRELLISHPKSPPPHITSVTVNDSSTLPFNQDRTSQHRLSSVSHSHTVSPSMITPACPLYNHHQNWTHSNAFHPQGSQSPSHSTAAVSYLAFLFLPGQLPAAFWTTAKVILPNINYIVSSLLSSKLPNVFSSRGIKSRSYHVLERPLCDLLPQTPATTH